MASIGAASIGAASVGAILAREIHGELLSAWRMPGFVLPTLLFPALFYTLFALLMPFGGGIHMPTWLLATHGVFGIMAPALFGFGVRVASERGEGWLRLKRVVPLPPLLALAARCAMAMLFALVVFVILASLGALFGEVRLARLDWLLLAAVLVVGTLPFCALGLAFGLWLSPQAAPAVVNLVYLPMAFLSGLAVPLAVFPGWLQTMAIALPPYHLAAIALHVVDARPSEHLLLHAAVLAGFTALCLAIAALGWRRAREG
jgi:ABC-2 type transport system permease protein